MTVPMSTVTYDTDFITRGIQTMPIYRPTPRGGTSPDVVEMRSSGPWPETEINTTSGDEATVVIRFLECVSLCLDRIGPSGVSLCR